MHATKDAAVFAAGQGSFLHGLDCDCEQSSCMVFYLHAFVKNKFQRLHAVIVFACSLRHHSSVSEFNPKGSTSFFFFLGTKYQKSDKSSSPRCSSLKCEKYAKPGPLLEDSTGPNLRRGSLGGIITSDGLGYVAHKSTGAASSKMSMSSFF
jgi:hypothetical protein